MQQVTRERARELLEKNWDARVERRTTAEQDMELHILLQAAVGGDEVAANIVGL